MRSLVIAGLFVLASAGTASAKDDDCHRTLDGGWRCTLQNGELIERRPTADGGAKTTSTDPSLWGKTDGYGRGITPHESVVNSSPILLGATRGRVSDPWERRAEPAPSKGGWRTPRTLAH